LNKNDIEKKNDVGKYIEFIKQTNEIDLNLLQFRRVATSNTKLDIS